MASNILGGNSIARNDYARAFIFSKGIFKCNTTGEFVSCISVDALAQDRGDVTKIECPSEEAYGEFTEVGIIPGELSRMTTTLTGRMSRTELSSFYKLFIDGCPFDLHLHFGLCNAPDAFNQYDKALVFENVYVTSFGTDPLIALQSADRAVINETMDISIGNFYELVNLVYGERANAQTTDDQIVTMEICDRRSCGADCDDASSGCDKIFAASSDYVAYYSDDAGLTWTRQVITGAPPVGGLIVDGTCWNDLWVLLDNQGTFWYVDRADLLDGVGVFSSVASALTGTGTSLDTNHGTGVIVGSNGNIAVFTDPEGGTTLVDAGFAAGNNTLNDVYIGDGAAVAVGNLGTVVYSYDTEVWYTSPTSPGAALTLTSVVVKSKNNWLVGTSNGQVWCTDDGGRTWGRVKYPTWLTNTGTVTDMQLSTRHVLYMTIGTALYRSIDGGSSWVAEPNSKLNFTTNGGLHSIATCRDNPNFVLVGGQGVGGDGMIIAGDVA